MGLFVLHIAWYSNWNSGRMRYALCLQYATALYAGTYHTEICHDWAAFSDILETVLPVRCTEELNGDQEVNLLVCFVSEPLAALFP